MVAKKTEERTKENPLSKVLTPSLMETAYRRAASWQSQEPTHNPITDHDWRLNTLDRLEDLSKEIQEGQTEQELFSVIPYPKKGDKIRHYCAPTIRQQTLASTYIALLGPTVDYNFKSFSLGNRLYRPLAFNEKNRLSQHHYSLAGNQIYANFDQGYSLFRKFSQMLVNHRLAPKNPPSKVKRESIEDNKKEEGLWTKNGIKHPYLNREDWREAWTPSETESDPAVYWIRLDLKLAFPSVNRDELIKVLRKLSYPEGRWKNVAAGNGNLDLFSLYEKEQEHPWTVLDENKNLRDNLLQSWSNFIAGSIYDRTASDSLELESIPKNPCPNTKSPCTGPCQHYCAGTWDPTYALDEGNEATVQLPGLPTGLCSSGFLLNVALHDIDHKIEEYSEQLLSQDSPVAVFRYADDYLILGTTAESVQKMYQFFESEITSSKHNFSINKEKIEPKKLLELPAKAQLHLLEKKKITVSEISRFETEVVGEVSAIEIHNQAWVEGPANGKTLAQLIKLASTDADDHEMTLDARMSFALGGIANIGWPEKIQELGIGSREQLHAKIQSIAARTIVPFPWRLKGWQNAIKVAMRIDAWEVREASQDVHELSGKKWLENLLTTITECCTPPPKNWNNFLSVEDGIDEDPNEIHWATSTDPKFDSWKQHRKQNRGLKNSLHRAIFLHSLAMHMRGLSKHFAQINSPNKEKITRSWRDDFYDEVESTSQPCPEIIAKIEAEYGWKSKWLNVLYPNELRLEKWEKQAALDFMLSSHDPKVKFRLSDLTTSKLKEHSVTKGVPCWFLDQLPEDDSLFFSFAWLNSGRYQLPSQSRKLTDLTSLQYNAFLQTFAVKTSTNIDLPSIADIPRQKGLDNNPWMGARRLHYYSTLWQTYTSLGQRPNVADLFKVIGIEERINLEEWPSVSLAEFMDAGQRIEPTLAPAIGITAQQANSLLDSIKGLDRDKGNPKKFFVISPENVFLEAKNAAPWINQRQLQVGLSHHALEEVKLPIPKCTRSDFHADAPAPAPAFLAPYFRKFGENRLIDWYEACFAIWIGSGSLETLELLTRYAPWRPAKQACTNLLSEFQIDPERDWVKTILDVKRERAGWVQEKTESKLRALSSSKIELFGEESRGDSSINIAVAQASNLIDASKVVRRALSYDWTLTPFDIKKVELELTETLHDLESRWLPKSENERPRILLFPEFFIAPSHIPAIQQFAQKTKIAVLAGVFLDAAPPSYPGHVMLNKKRSTVLRNRCILVLPQIGVETEEELLVIAPYFVIPKLMPSVIENSMLKYLNSNTKMINKITKDGNGNKVTKSVPEKHWSVQYGVQIPIFDSPRIGEFSVGICSDLLAAIQWQKLRGQVHHLFYVAFNRAIELFHTFSASRSYEMYANVVICNHGIEGGSAARTPKMRPWESTIVQMDGKNQSLLAYVDLPMNALEEAQLGKLAHAEENDFKELLGSLPKKEREAMDSWFAPPPDYRREPPKPRGD